LRMDFSKQYFIEDEGRDVMGNPFRANHIKNSMFIKDLVR
jgi:hypothetical protein